jgi:uncharacterized peroxidase-related enzyme
MNQFTVHSISSAPLASQALLSKAQQAYGFVPNLFAGMAESPALLEGYINLTGAFNKSALSETERQVIMMSANRIHDCTYCMAAHTTVMQGSNIDAAVIKALRDNSPIADAKLEALRQFSIKLVERRGRLAAGDVEALLAFGYSRETALEVILGVGLKVLSNYAADVAKTPLDAVFESNAWADAA